MPARSALAASSVMFLLSIMVLALPAAAQSATFGEVVSIGDEGVVRVLESGNVPDSWVWLDTDTDDDDDDYDGNEQVYLVRSSSRISNNDIRVGSGQVSARTLDDDEDLRSLGGSLDFLDDDGDGRFDTDDGLYYDVSGDGGSGEVSDLDIHLAGASASDGTDLDGYSGDFTYVDRDGDEAYGDNDDVYLDSDRDDLLTAADVGIAGEHRRDVVDGDDDAVVHALDTSGAPTSWAFLDEDGDGQLGQDEPVYLAGSSSQVQLHDVRVANPRDGSAGSQVRSGDDDQGDDLTSLGGELAYADEDGDNEFGASDPLYYDRSSGDSGRVSVNDVVLTGSNAGTLVASSYASVGDRLTSLSPDVAYDDIDGDDNYGKDDEVYLDVTTTGFVSGLDVQLSDEIGRVVLADDADAIRAPSTSNAPDTLVVVENDQDARPEPGDPIYLQQDTGRVAVGSVRVASAPTGGLGSQVRAGDADFNDPTSTVQGSLAYLDTEDDDVFTDEDTLYYDLSGSRSGEVSTGDVILSGSRAGRVVESGDDRMGRSLASYGGSFAFLDANGDESFGLDDGVVLDTDDDGYLTVADVWLRGPNAAQPDQPDAPDDGGGDDGDAGGDGGDGGGDGEPADGAEPATLARRLGAAFTVEANQTVRFEGNLPAGVDAFALTFDRACRDCSASLTTQQTPLQDVPEPPSGWRVLDYHQIEVRDADGNATENVARSGYLAFETARSELASVDAQPAQVVLLHYARAWEPVETTLSSSSSPGADPLAFNATLPGLSAFATAIDRQAPEVTGHAPTGSTASNRPTITLTWEDNRAVDPNTARLTVDGTPQTSATGSLQAIPSGLTYAPGQALAEGPHTVNATVRDTSGLETTHAWTFRVSDATCPQPPRITGLEPAPDATNVSTNAKVRVSVEATSCRIASSTLLVNGSAVPSTVGAGRVTGVLPGGVGPNETVELYVEVTDEGQNTAERAWTVTTAGPEPGDADDAPGPTLAWLVGLLVIVAATARRRRRG